MPTPRAANGTKESDIASLPRRSPRFHQSPNNSHHIGIRASDMHSVQRSLFSRSPKQNCASKRRSISAEKDSNATLDRAALAIEVENNYHEYPPPPSPLPLDLNDEDMDGEETEQQPAFNTQATAQHALSFPAPSTLPPSTFAPSTLPPSTFAPSTQPPSTFAPSTQPPSTFAPSTQPPSTFAPSTQPPSSFAPSTQPPSTLAPSTQPPSTLAPSTQPPSTFVPSTQPPSTFAPSTQPPSTVAPSAQPPPSTFAPSTQPPPPTHEGPSQLPASTYEGTTQPPSQNVVPLAEELGEDGNAHENRSSVDENAANAESNNTDELLRLYVHLHRITVYEQKSICAAFNVNQRGNKKVRGARLFVVLSGIMERSNRTAFEVLQQKALEKSKDFKTEYDRTMDTWGEKEDNTVIPPMTELEAEAGVRQHPCPRQADDLIDDQSDEEEELNAAAHGATGVSLDEFARLMIIFRDVPEAAEDLRRSGQDLSREDLDTGRMRNAFWNDRIETIFNDPSYITNEDLYGELQDIDPGRPVTAYRDGSCLQDLFAKFRKEFTEAYGNWDVSGNNEHSTFVNFCRLPRTKTLSRSGTRCLIAWHIFRFGTPGQNDLLLDFCSKQMATGSGAHLESGFGLDVQRSETNSRSTKRRTSDEALTKNINSVLQKLVSDNQGDEPESKRKRRELEDVQLTRARREDDCLLMKQLMETHEHRVQQNQPVDQRVSSIIDGYYNRLVEDAVQRMNRDAERISS